MITNTRNQLHENCFSIAKQLEQNGQNQDTSIFDDALDIEFTCSAKGDFIGARILVASGGPNIWVDTLYDTFEGSWGSDRTEVWFNDDNFIHELCEQYFECI